MNFLQLALVTLSCSAATINFGADYQNTVSGPLKSGEKVTIEYDLSRAKCPHASTHGADTWGVYAYVAFNQKFENTQSFAIARTPFPGSPQVVSKPIVELQKGDMAVWIMCSSMAGTTYDSNFGKNFHFSVL
ncbi:hypothetical protein BC833DRAFT_604471 [Globomyces pollinis-pini]|nr:hypothetical protein BC833DRAFT_604471 [Globomyces pollinis-pini]